MLCLFAGCTRNSNAADKERSLDVVAEELGFADFSIDSFERRSLEQRQLYEDTVTSCMLQKGFEYIPEYDKRPTNQPALEGGESAADYAETHGWGVSETLLPQSAGSPSPNALYRRTLSDAELEAYDYALWRSGGDVTPCADVATQKVASESKLAVAFDEYGDQFRELVERFWSDLRITSFHGEWSTCMSQRGYDYPTPQRMQTDLEDRSSDLTAAGPTEFEDEFKQLITYETGAAGASLDCGVPPAVAGQPDIYRIVLTDLAHRFLQDNPDFSQS